MIEVKASQCLWWRLVVTSRSTMFGLLFLKVFTAWKTSTQRCWRNISHTILILQNTPLRPPPFLRRRQEKEDLWVLCQQLHKVAHKNITAYIHKNTPQKQKHLQLSQTKNKQIIVHCTQDICFQPNRNKMIHTCHHYIRSKFYHNTCRHQTFEHKF